MIKWVPVCVAVFHSALKSASWLSKSCICFTVYFHTFIVFFLQSLNYLFNLDLILRGQASLVLIFEAGKWSGEGAWEDRKRHCAHHRTNSERGVRIHSLSHIVLLHYVPMWTCTPLPPTHTCRLYTDRMEGKLWKSGGLQNYSIWSYTLEIHQRNI